MVDISDELAALIVKLGVADHDAIAELVVRPKLVTVSWYAKDADGFVMDRDTGDPVIIRTDVEVET